MKKMSVLLKMAVAMFLVTYLNSSALAQGEAPVKKPKVVSITFTPNQAKARRNLTHSEAIRQAASVRHQKRLQAGYNQPIPF